jgi:hypothetical protein
MRILHRPAVRLLAAAALAGALAACGENGPSGPFDPAGTSADIGTVQGMFATSSFNSFSAMSAGMDAVLGSSITASVGAVENGAATVGSPAAGAASYARRLTALLPRGTAAGWSASSGAIPPAALGKTFVYTAESGYIASDRTGAPSDGVRFVLYAVDPLTRQPVTPLTETGYVDVVDHSGDNDVDVRVLAVSGTTTFIDYAITASGTASGGNIRVQGFVSDLTDRANFDLNNHVAVGGSSLALTLDYDLRVPTRDIILDFTVHGTSAFEGLGNGDMSLLLQGPHGKVEMEGDFDTAGGTLAVKVNGNDFATVTVNGQFDPTVTNGNGDPLTPDEEAALRHIAAVVGDAFEVVTGLVAPADALVSL